MPRLPPNKDEFQPGVKYVWNGILISPNGSKNLDHTKITLWPFSQASCWCDGVTPTEALSHINDVWEDTGGYMDEEQDMIRAFLKYKGVTIRGLIKFQWIRLLKSGHLKRLTEGYKCPLCVANETDEEAEEAEAAPAAPAAAEAAPAAPAAAGGGAAAAPPPPAPAPPPPPPDEDPRPAAPPRRVVKLGKREREKQKKPSA